MWALVKDGTIEKVYEGAIATTIGDIQYPRNMFTLYSTDEKKAIGIYNVVRKDRPNGAFYNIGTSSYTYDAGDDVVNENFNTTEKDIAPIKAEWKDNATRTAFGLIRPYAWLAERYVFDNTKAIPAGVKSYAAAVRTHCDTICTDIDNCSNLDDIKTVHAKIHDGGEYFTWPDESSIVAHKRMIPY